MSGYQDEIRQALKPELDAGHLRELGHAADMFALLTKTYPAIGSKIDWKRIPGAIERIETDQFVQSARFAEFFDEMCALFALKDPVIYVGDSATDFSLAGSISSIRRILPMLLQIPQHHYFVGPNGSWVMCMTMEGDMGFGAAEVSSPH